MRAPAYTILWRVVLGTLVGVAWLNVVAMLAIELTHAIPAIVTVRTFAYFTAAPLVVTWALERVALATITVGDGLLVVARRDVTIDVPLDGIADVRPWRIMLPRPGLALRMRTGRPLRYGLATGDPAPLLAALADAGVASARTALASVRIVYTHAAASAPRSRLDRPLPKFVVFALLPACLVFNLDQHITYGGLLGQYYLEGSWAWVQSFLTMWAAAGIDLLLYAVAWRVPAEAIAFALTLARPARAASIRRAIEIVCRVAFYAGIPALLGMRLLA